MSAMKSLVLITIVATALFAGCSSDTGSEGDSSPSADAEHHDGADGASGSDAADGAGGADADQADDAGDGGAGSDAALAPPWDPDDSLGGDRPAEVLLPDDYSTSRSWPLVILLHGYSASAMVQDGYFRLSDRRHDRGFITVLPNGTRDASGKRFWNATNACCNFADGDVDDVVYLSSLVSEANQRLAVDTERVYFMGHSNGGFMSYRMACELGSQISAIASLAGSSFDDAQDCAEDGQVGVLQIHGDSDDTVLYEGGEFFGEAYPGAREVAQRWAGRNGCGADPETGDSIDAVSSIDGAETEVERWTNCDPSTSVELWTIEGGGLDPQIQR